jgi:hypothetical protein
MRPTSAMRDGMSPDRYIRYPSRNPLPKPEQNCGPSRNYLQGAGIATWYKRTPQCQNRHKTDNTCENEHRLHHARRDIAERKGFANPFDEWKDDYGSCDIADGEENFEEGAHGNACLESSAEDVPGVFEYRLVEEERWDREYECAGEEQPKNE